MRAEVVIASDPFEIPREVAARVLAAARDLAGRAEPEPVPREACRLDTLAEALLALLARRSPGTAEHSRRVAALAREMGAARGLARPEREVLHAAALLHDIGKLGSPDRVLTKPGRLSGREAAEMRRHTTDGAALLSGTPALARVGRIVGEHHEKLDGSGYPRGLDGAAQDPLTRIVVAADVYDALTGQRVYKPGMSGDAALATMAGEMAGELDPALLDLLARLRPGA